MSLGNLFDRVTMAAAFAADYVFNRLWPAPAVDPAETARQALVDAEAETEVWGRPSDPWHVKDGRWQPVNPSTPVESSPTAQPPAVGDRPAAAASPDVAAGLPTSALLREAVRFLDWRKPGVVEVEAELCLRADLLADIEPRCADK